MYEELQYNNCNANQLREECCEVRRKRIRQHQLRLLARRKATIPSLASISKDRGSIPYLIQHKKKGL